MTLDDVDVLVIGAGVSGLTTAVCLAEDGLRVHIWTAEPPLATTSAAAGALWEPYLVESGGRVRVWSAQTLEVLQSLATVPETGVRLVSGIEASRAQADPPEWSNQLDRFRICEANELPHGFAVGWRFTAPVVDMPTYLGHLERRFTATGGDIKLRRLDSLGEAACIAPVVVNCAGVGARELVSDESLTPVRGQVVVVENPGIDEFFVEDPGLSPELLYFFPHGDTLVLGGTAQSGNWSREPDPAVAAAIVERCADVAPLLRDAPVIGHRVGLRPARPHVRVEEQLIDGTHVIHNYGHGGAGITLSWGCASEVVNRVRSAR